MSLGFLGPHVWFGLRSPFVQVDRGGCSSPIFSRQMLLMVAVVAAAAVAGAVEAGRWLLKPGVVGKALAAGVRRRSI